MPYRKDPYKNSLYVRAKDIPGKVEQYNRLMAEENKRQREKIFESIIFQMNVGMSALAALDRDISSITKGRVEDYELLGLLSRIHNDISDFRGKTSAWDTHIRRMKAGR